MTEQNHMSDDAQAVGKFPEWHTPLPWAASTRQGSWDWVIYSTKDPNIEICQLFHDGTEDNETGEANADLIVRAVNALAAQPPAAPVETKRKTFTIPPGHEAVRDSEGRATGEVRPRSSAGNVELLIENLIQSAVEYENNCDRLVAKTIRVELEKAKQAIRDALTLAQPQALRTCATCHAVLADGPQPAATHWDEGYDEGCGPDSQRAFDKWKAEGGK